jgi:hypothetical protein
VYVKKKKSNPEKNMNPICPICPKIPFIMSSTKSEKTKTPTPGKPKTVSILSPPTLKFPIQNINSAVVNDRIIGLMKSKSFSVSIFNSSTIAILCKRRYTSVTKNVEINIFCLVGILFRNFIFLEFYT